MMVMPFSSAHAGHACRYVLLPLMFETSALDAVVGALMGVRIGVLVHEWSRSYLDRMTSM